MSFLKGLKAKAENKATKGASKGTTWTVTDAKVQKSIAELIALQQESKSLEKKIAILKGQVVPTAYDRWLSDYVKGGGAPPTPMTLATQKGESVTYVVQDRSGKVSDETKQALVGVIGEDATAKVLYEETKVAFSREALSDERVMAIVDEVLSALAQRVADEVSPEAAEGLFSVENQVSFRPGVFDNLVHSFGSDRIVLDRVLAVVGSASTRYIKV